MWINDLIHM